MKTTAFLIAIALASVAGWNAKAATLIEYRFDMETRTDGKSFFYDSSGNNYHLEYNGAIANPSHSSPFADAYPPDSTENKNARNGTSNDNRWGRIQNVPDGIFTDWNTNGSFTLEGWVKVDNIVTAGGTPQQGILWALRSSTGGESRFQLRYNTDRTVSAWWYSLGNAATNTTLTSTETITLGEWTHLAYIYDRQNNGTLTLYIDGVAVLSQSGLNANLPTSITIPLGGVASNISGSFDDFRFSNTALSREELGFFAPFTPIPEPSSAALLLGGCGLLMIFMHQRGLTSRAR